MGKKKKNRQGQAEGIEVPRAAGVTFGRLRKEITCRCFKLTGRFFSRRGIRSRLPVGKVDRGAAALRLAMHSWSSWVNHWRVPDEGSGAFDTRTLGSRCRLPAGKGRSGSCSVRLAMHSWSSWCITSVFQTRAETTAAATITRTHGRRRRLPAEKAGRGAVAYVWPCIPGAAGASPACSRRRQRRRWQLRAPRHVAAAAGHRRGSPIEELQRYVWPFIPGTVGASLACSGRRQRRPRVP